MSPYYVHVYLCDTPSCRQDPSSYRGSSGTRSMYVLVHMYMYVQYSAEPTAGRRDDEMCFSPTVTLPFGQCRF